MDLHLDRLSLSVNGLAEADARRLARLLPERLAGLGAEAPQAVAQLRVSLAARPGEGIEAMAGRIALQIAAALARAS